MSRRRSIVFAIAFALTGVTGLFAASIVGLSASGSSAERATAAELPQASPTTDRAALERQLIANERATLAAFFRQDTAAFMANLVPDAFGIDPTGPVTAADWERMLGDARIAKWDVDQAQVHWIAPDAAMLVYRLAIQGAIAGQPLPPAIWCSTMWVHREGKWRAAFHQETAAAGAAQGTRPNAPAAAQDWGQRIRWANEELLNKGNVSTAREIFAPAYVSHGGAGGDLRGGPELIERFVGELRTAFPDLRVDVEVLATQGNRVAWLRTHRGTQKAEFMGVPASGRTIVWQEMVVSRFEAGKIAEEWGVSDLGERLRTP